MSRSAITTGPRPVLDDLSYEMKLDGKTFYLMPMLYMAKSQPQETCVPDHSPGTPRYTCEEGQRYVEHCHAMVFDEQLSLVGYHQLKVNVPFPHFCNAIPAVGVANKRRNEIALTIQYFPIDRPAASKIADIGSGWQRTTLLLRLKEQNGKVFIEQDDRCLGNPNTIDTIPDARKALKKCDQRGR